MLSVPLLKVVKAEDREDEKDESKADGSPVPETQTRETSFFARTSSAIVSGDEDEDDQMHFGRRTFRKAMFGGSSIVYRHSMCASVRKSNYRTARQTLGFI